VSAKDPLLFSALDMAEIRRAYAALEAAPSGSAQIMALQSLASVVGRLAFRIALDLSTVTGWGSR